MLVNVQAFILDAGRNTQAVKLLYAVEKGETTYGCPKVDDEDAEAFGSEEAPAIPVEDAITR